MWNVRTQTKIPSSDCLAYQHPETDVVTNFRGEHKLIKPVGNAEHFVLGAWALKVTVNKLAVP